MAIKCTNIDSFAQFHDFIESIGDKTIPKTIFRGHKCASDLITPGIGRIKFHDVKKSVIEHERIIFSSFCQRAPLFLTVKPQDNWDWLTLAQHHGLPTRFLDWTRNPLVALYFSVENDESKIDAAVWVAKELPEIKQQDMPNPFDVSIVHRFTPRRVTPRVTAQSGVFTVHPHPFESIAGSPNIEKLLIPAKSIRKMRKTLYDYGVHREALFPDMDGLARHIRWIHEAYKK